MIPLAFLVFFLLLNCGGQASTPLPQSQNPNAALADKFSPASSADFLISFVNAGGPDGTAKRTCHFMLGKMLVEIVDDANEPISVTVNADSDFFGLLKNINLYSLADSYEDLAQTIGDATDVSFVFSTSSLTKTIATRPIQGPQTPAQLQNLWQRCATENFS